VGSWQKLVSSTDPDATYATKGGTPARLGYYDNYLAENHSCVIVGVQACTLKNPVTRSMKWGWCNSCRPDGRFAARATAGRFVKPPIFDFTDHSDSRKLEAILANSGR